MQIKKIHAREILDSRGNPTISVKVVLKNGAIGVASVPSGASTGAHEALELRDKKKKRFGGKGVKKAVKNINEIIAKKLKGLDVVNQRKVDEMMIKLDGTKNKSKLGANAILGVSLACAHAVAKAENLPLYKHIRKVYNLKLRKYKLPSATMNIINGGAHAGWNLDIQEFMIVPKARTFKEKLRIGAEIFHSLKSVLKKKGQAVTVGDEGGFAPSLGRNEDAFRLILEAIKKAGYKSKKDVYLAIDAAASEFYKKHIYKIDKKKLSAEKLINLYKLWLKKYPIILIEDGLAEDDWKNWVKLTKSLNKKVLLVGDDLFTTSVARLEKGVLIGVANTILIKLNQIGTLTETIDCINFARKNKYKVIISHRSGETCDTTIADLAVAVNADYIKTGSLSRSERVSKYNRLLEIEEEL
ncbi:MAG: phosphopyruvate hydratase [Patescibacteria group bacterium]|nr:phosphopyruvate hydratase [Patescibacteria group bacterium]